MVSKILSIIVTIASMTLLAMTGCGPQIQDEDEDQDQTPKTIVDEDPLAIRDLSPREPETAEHGRPDPVQNLSELFRQLPTTPRLHSTRKLRIAVLDNGFAGWEASVKDGLLPDDTKLIEGPKNSQAPTDHGAKMAEIAHQIFRYQNALAPAPQFILINSHGFTNLKAAIDQVIKVKPDLVLYSQVWEYGGNFDGKGFINREINRALYQGIPWVNAAGNVGLTTLRKEITKNSFGSVTLPYQSRYARLQVTQEGTPVKVVASWSDFQDTIHYRTSKDINLVLKDLQGNVIASSEWIQDGKDHGDRPGYSSHAREIVRTTLSRGVYLIEAPIAGGDFHSTDRLNITVDGFATVLQDRTEQNSLLIPADNPGLTIIGASDVNYSSQATEAWRQPHQLWFPSKITFQSGRRVHGTSAATAIAVGYLARVMATGVDFAAAAHFVHRDNQ